MTQYTRTNTERRQPSVCSSRLLRWPEAFGPDGMIPASKGTIYNWINDGILAPPVKLGARISAWRLSDLEDFIKRCEEATRTGKPIAPANQQASGEE